MALHNYISWKSQEDIIFIEYNRNPIFFYDFLADIIPRSQNEGNQRPSRMNYDCDEIKK